MSKKENIKFIISGSLFFMLALLYVSTRVYSIYGNRIVPLHINDHIIYSEVVSSGEKMRKGLGERRGLCSSCGMLFEFGRSGKYSFWMKEMKFPLDIIWIKENKIVHIEQNIQPSFAGSLNSFSEADMVLEVNAGVIKALGIKTDDEISF